MLAIGDEAEGSRVRTRRVIRGLHRLTAQA
jgi:hypothetical protein